MRKDEEEKKANQDKIQVDAFKFFPFIEDIVNSILILFRNLKI